MKGLNSGLIPPFWFLVPPFLILIPCCFNGVGENIFTERYVWVIIGISSMFVFGAFNNQSESFFEEKDNE